MANLLTIAAAKAVLLAVIALWVRPPASGLARLAVVSLATGTAFGLAFFAMFYLAVPAIEYGAPVTVTFVAVNAALSYALTAATVALFPIDLPRRKPGPVDLRDRAYFTVLVGLSAAAFALSENAFARAFAIGAALMAVAEGSALLAGRSGPVSRMLHGEFAPLLKLLVMTAGLGVFYETANLAFPVWTWIALAALPAPARTGLMMGIGYIILTHPMFIAMRLAAVYPRS